MKQPWYFEVNEYGTIGEADDTGPEVNKDVYEDIYVKGLLTPEDIIAEVDQYDELQERFQERCAEEAARKAVSINNQSAPAWANLAAVLMEMDSPQAALAAAEKALAIDPGDAVAQNVMKRCGSDS